MFMFGVTEGVGPGVGAGGDPRIVCAGRSGSGWHRDIRSPQGAAGGAGPGFDPEQARAGDH